MIWPILLNTYILFLNKSWKSVECRVFHLPGSAMHFVSFSNTVVQTKSKRYLEHLGFHLFLPECASNCSASHKQGLQAQPRRQTPLLRIFRSRSLCKNTASLPKHKERRLQTIPEMHISLKVNLFSVMLGCMLSMLRSNCVERWLDQIVWDYSHWFTINILD